MSEAAYYKFPGIGSFSLSFLSEIEFHTTYQRREGEITILELECFNALRQLVFGKTIRMFSPTECDRIQHSMKAFEDTIQSLCAEKATTFYHFPGLGGFSRSYLARVKYITEPDSTDHFWIHAYGENCPRNMSWKEDLQESLECLEKTIHRIKQTTPQLEPLSLPPPPVPKKSAGSDDM